MVTAEVLVYERLRLGLTPVMSVEIGVPTLSWPLSLEQELESGKRYDVFHISIIREKEWQKLLSRFKEKYNRHLAFKAELQKTTKKLNSF